MATVTVIAGTNGAGKSSVAGARLAKAGGEYFNPDEVTRQIRSENPEVSEQQANIEAWQQGKRLLESAIEERKDFMFETTLGGNTITSLLEKAMDAGIEVRIFYVALASPELHIERVRSRVAKGGHDIPEAKIRERYHQSRLNLIRLLPKLTELLVFDNSKDGDPAEGRRPEPMLLLHLVRGKVKDICDVGDAPEWAKPILLVAIQTAASPARRGKGTHA